MFIRLYALPLLMISLLLSCAEKQPVSQPSLPQIPGSTIEHIQKEVTQETQQPSDEASPGTHDIVQHWVDVARKDGDIDAAIAALNEISTTHPFPINADADFRRVQLLLDGDYPEAVQEAQALMRIFPQHALVPELYLSLSRWYARQMHAAQALLALEELLAHPNTRTPVRRKALEDGVELIEYASNWSATRWLLSVALYQDDEHADAWFRLAAQTASIDTLERLARSGELKPAMAPFLLKMARQQLVLNRKHNISRIQEIVDEAMPNSSVGRTLKHWLEADHHEIHIGVLLPLSGPHKSYGEEALRGIRLASAAPLTQGNVILHIQDSGAGSSATIAGYQQLVHQRVDFIVGPLLNQSVEAIIPYMQPHIPVLALNADHITAAKHAALFVHNLSPAIQAIFMAEQVRSRGIKQMVLIEDAADHYAREALAFTQAFERQGGEIVEHIKLNASVDNRQQLRTIREKTDHEILLHQLKEDLVLFSPETNMSIQLPINFDAMYIVAEGKKVASLAGQLAYLETIDLPLYGSDRWQQDGLLLNDKGRYLEYARFIHIPFPNDNDAKVQFVQRQYRDVWGNDTPSKLFAVAYDSTNILTFIGLRQRISGKKAVYAMQTAEGFPGITGHVRFNTQGSGLKSFYVYRARKDSIHRIN